MKKETFKEPIGLADDGQVHATLPVAFANHLLTRTNIAELGLPLLKALALRHSSEVIYPFIKDKVEDDWGLISDQLWTEGFSTQADFFMAVSKMLALKQNDGVEFLNARGVRIDPEESESAFLARIYLTKGNELDQFLEDLIATQGNEIEGKLFHVYSLRVTQAQLANFPLISNSVLAAKMTEKYRDLAYGPYCAVSRVGQSPHVGFMIDHGTKIVDEPRIISTEKLSLRSSRAPKTATILLAPDSQALWVHCHNKNNAPMYADVISEILGGEAVPELKSFELNHFLDINLGQRLAASVGQLGLQRICVAAFDVKTADGGWVCLPTKRSGCLTEIFDEYRGAINSTNELRMIKLRIHFGPEQKPSFIELKPGSIKVGKGLDTMTVSAILVALSVWMPSANA